MKINTGLAALLGICGVLLCAGCDTINRSQYQVLGPARADGVRLAVTAEQQQAVREVLQTVAKELRFQERTERSLVPNTIASYGEKDNLNPITFIAYVTKDTILIDILHSNTAVGESCAIAKSRTPSSPATTCSRAPSKVTVAPPVKNLPPPKEPSRVPTSVRPDLPGRLSK
jgi:hypothetical protein